MSMFRCRIPVVGVLALAAACSGADRNTAPAGALDTTAAAAPVTNAAPATQVTTPTPAPDQNVSPAPQGNVIEVKMTMQGSEGRYEPAKITAQRGDVLHFVNGENVHNVHFPQANNPSGVTYPPPSPYLTQPGQAYDLKVDFPPGTYNFQCDPHAAGGMVGELTVTG